MDVQHRKTSSDGSAELFGIHLEVISKLLQAEEWRLSILQRDLGNQMRQSGIQKEREIEQMNNNIRRTKSQCDQLKREYDVAARRVMRRNSSRRKSSRSQPAIGLKQLPKTRPTIFGTLTTEKSPSEKTSYRQSINPQMSTLCHMFAVSHQNEVNQNIPQIDEKDTLIYQDGKLLAGSLEALIQHLVPTTDYYPDRTYIFAFLLSSRLYIRPHSLLNQVCQTCTKQQGLNRDGMTRERLAQFGPNIIQLLSEWTEMFPYDFRDERMMRHLKEITQKIVGFYPALNKDAGIINANLISRLSALQKYEEILSRVNNEIMQRSVNIVPLTDITEVCPSPLILAQQLTHVELERLSQIGPEEFVQAFAKETDLETTYKDVKRTSNLEAYVQWFNRLSYWVATEICMHLKKKQRIKSIEYFIDVAKECCNIGNFNSLMAIIAGMNISSVARLKKTWAKVNKAKFEILEHQMDPSSNFNSYRSSLQAALWRLEGAVDDREKIVIPFFSLLVKDLYFLNEGCSNKLPNGHINFGKFWQFAKQITAFITWQQVECPFERHDPVLTYVLTNPVFSENTLSLASFECENPENHFEKDRLKQLTKTAEDSL